MKPLLTKPFSGDSVPEVKSPEELSRLRREISRGWGLLGLSSSFDGLSALSTGIFDLDQALPGGGIPRGKLTEVSGPPASGKTALVLRFVSHALSLGEPTTYLDVMRSLDLQSCERAGVSLQRLLVVRPPSLQAAFQSAEELLRSGGFGLVVLDLAGMIRKRAISLPSLFRLSRISKEVDATVLLLTDAVPGASGFGSTISLRLSCQVVQSVLGPAIRPPHLARAYRVRFEITKSKSGMAGTFIDVVMGITPLL